MIPLPLATRYKRAWLAQQAASRELALALEQIAAAVGRRKLMGVTEQLEAEVLRERERKVERVAS